MVVFLLTTVALTGILHPGPVYIEEGGNVTLPTCFLSGHPTPWVWWTNSSGHMLQESVRANYSVLKIRNAKPADSGIYVCTAHNLLGKLVQQTQLIVVSPPKFNVTPPKVVRAIPGDVVTLNCGAVGKPAPIISWKRGEEQLHSGKLNHSSSSTLIFPDIKTEEEGNYTCIATIAQVSQAFAITNVLVSHGKGLCFI